MGPYESKKLKSNELIDRLNICLDASVLNEFELKRLEQEATKLTSEGQSHISKASGFFILGALASARLNVTEMDRCFKAAIAWSDTDNLPVYTLNYVVATQRAFGVRQAADLSETLVKNHFDDIGILKQTVDCAETACRFELAKKLRGRLEALGVVYDSDGGFTHVAPLLSRMSDQQVSSDDLLDRIETAAELLRRHKLRYMGASMFVSDSGESIYSFSVVVDPDTAAELNFEIADALAEKFDDPMESVLSITVLPYEHYE